MPKTSANAERGMDGVEKAAILLIALGPEKSAQIAHGNTPSHDLYEIGIKTNRYEIGRAHV